METSFSFIKWVAIYHLLVDGTATSIECALAPKGDSETWAHGADQGKIYIWKSMLWSAASVCLSVSVCACVSLRMIHGVCTHKHADVHAHADGKSQASSDTPLYSWVRVSHRTRNSCFHEARKLATFLCLASKSQSYRFLPPLLAFSLGSGIRTQVLILAQPPFSPTESGLPF